MGIGKLQVTTALQLLKTIRLFRLGRLLRKLDQFSAAVFLRILKLICTYTMIVHWFACIWFWLGTMLSLGDIDCWIKQLELEREVCLNPNLCARSEIISSTV